VPAALEWLRLEGCTKQLRVEPDCAGLEKWQKWMDALAWVVELDQLDSGIRKQCREVLQSM
jgi:hypothetical protein